MKVMSGKTGFVYDLKNDILLDSGLVAHGFGSRIKADGGQNLAMKAAHFAALGSYGVGQSYNGRYGNLQITWVRCHQRQIIL
jgi:hypothetical protein